MAVRFADVVATDNKTIQYYVQCECGRRDVMIAYGGDHAFRPTYDRKISTQYGLDGLRHAFKVWRSQRWTVFLIEKQPLGSFCF